MTRSRKRRCRTAGGGSSERLREAEQEFGQLAVVVERVVRGARAAVCKAPGSMSRKTLKVCPLRSPAARAFATSKSRIYRVVAHQAVRLERPAPFSLVVSPAVRAVHRIALRFLARIVVLIRVHLFIT